jgi:hypothetical protein
MIIELNSPVGKGEGNELCVLSNDCPGLDIPFLKEMECLLKLSSGAPFSIVETHCNAPLHPFSTFGGGLPTSEGLFIL